VILPNCYSSEEIQHQEALNPLIVQSSQSNHVLCENYTFKTQHQT